MGLYPLLEISMDPKIKYGPPKHHSFQQLPSLCVDILPSIVSICLVTLITKTMNVTTLEIEPVTCKIWRYISTFD